MNVKGSDLKGEEYIVSYHLDIIGMLEYIRMQLGS